MQLRIAKSELQQGITVVQNVISSKAPVASLSSVKLDAREGQVTFTGTDLKVTAQLTLPVEVVEQGMVSLHAPSLSDVVRELPDVEVELDTKGTDTVTVACQDVLFKLHTSPIEDFPEIPEPETDVELSMASERILDVLSKVEFSISRDQSRYMLTGALLQVEDNTLRAVSTDGRRMSIATAEIEPASGLQYTAVIPHKTVQELLRVVHSGSTVQIKAGTNRITFLVDGLRIISTVLEGRYPDYKQVLPEEYSKELVFDTALFTSSVRRVAAVATRNYNCIRIQFHEGLAVLTSATPEVGEAREQMSVDYRGPEINVAFNPDYLLDVLKVISTENTVLRLEEDEGAGVFLGQNDDSGVFIVMPIRL